jgi:hypothetical protein
MGRRCATLLSRVQRLPRVLQNAHHHKDCEPRVRLVDVPRHRLAVDLRDVPHLAGKDAVGRKRRCRDRLPMSCPSTFLDRIRGNESVTRGLRGRRDEQRVAAHLGVEPSRRGDQRAGGEDPIDHPTAQLALDGLLLALVQHLAGAARRRESERSNAESRLAWMRW